MREIEIKNAIRTINAKLEEALEREKETEGTEDTVIWHMVGNDYKCAINALEEIQQYRAIGTVEECREARERQKGKKPLQGEPYTWISSVRIKGRYRDVRKTSYHHICPNCRENVAMDMNCCKYCGQAIDWSDAP